MKIYLRVIILIQLSFCSIYSQSSWFVQFVHDKEELFDLFAADTSYVWAVGDNGVILYTSNGGSTWGTQASSISDALNTVYFINNMTGYAAGESGIIKTVNRGSAWTVIFTSDTISINSIYFTDALTGYAAGSTGDDGYIFRTTNGGSTWAGGQVFTNSGALNSVYFVNSSTGTAVGGDGDSYIILRTTNGGVNWVMQNGTQPPLLYSVFFVNSLTGFVSGEGRIGKTTDGGNSWGFQNTPAIGNLYVTFSSANTGYAIDNSGTFIKTTNNGAVWNYQDSIFYSFSNVSITFANDLKGWALGSFEGTGTIYYTVNGGTPIGVEPISTVVPERFELQQNYPNPFNPSTNVMFKVPEKSQIKIGIYNSLGKEEDVLVNETLQAGTYRVVWNSSGFPSGVYYCVLSSGSTRETIKMVLIK